MKIRCVFRAIQYVHQAEKWWIYSTAAINIILGFGPITQLWITKELINAISELFLDVNNSIMSVIWLLLTQFFILIIFGCIEKIKDYLDQIVELKLTHNLQIKILDKIASVPYVFLDNHEFFEHFNRIQSGQGDKFIAPIKNVFEILKITIGIVSLLVYLIQFHWLLVIFSVLTALPVLYLRTKLGQQRFQMLLKQTPLLREIQYIQSVLEWRQSSKEIRLYGLKNYFLQRWSERYEEKKVSSLALYRKDHTQAISIELFTNLVYVITAVMVILMGQTRRVTIGDFFAIIQAVQGTQESISQISTRVANIYEESLYIQDYFEFLQYKNDTYGDKNETVSFPNPLRDVISLENVSFRYEGSTTDALGAVSLSIRKGEKIAIVGENGSGKTTLVKCMIGLYQPNSGDICFDQISISRINKMDLWENIAVLFQDFMQYAFTVRENIAFGNVKRMHDEAWLRKVAKISGIDDRIDKFEHKYDTYLGKFLFDGEDLSGGLWQRIAMARAIFRNGQIIIFDEPTAALDPYAEMEFFKQIRSLTENKTTIFVTHRIASARIADRIVVMKNGQVAEVGTHDELMSRKSEYYNMYQTQAKWYSKEAGDLQEMVGWAH